MKAAHHAKHAHVVTRASQNEADENKNKKKKKKKKKNELPEPDAHGGLEMVTCKKGRNSIRGGVWMWPEAMPEELQDPVGTQQRRIAKEHREQGEADLKIQKDEADYQRAKRVRHWASLQLDSMVPKA